MKIQFFCICFISKLLFLYLKEQQFINLTIWIRIKQYSFVDYQILKISKIITMYNRNKSLSKLSPMKTNHLQNTRTDNSTIKSKQKQTPNRQKSKRSLSLKSNISKQKSKPKLTRQENLNIIKIEKQYTKSMYQRFQQKLSICVKIEDLIQQIKDREKKLNSYFQLYRIFQSQIGQQRCLQHNNDLSLYCQTQNKVLCVHCVYGQNKHKTHKVIPLKDCIKNVTKDISHLEIAIKEDVQMIKIKVKTSEMNEKFIEKHFHQELQDLEKSYIQKLRQIESQFDEKKQYVNQYFENLIKKNTQLTSTLKDFQKNVHLKLTMLNRDELTAKQDVKQISKQTILSKIAQLSNLNGLALDDLDQKDIGQNTLRNRIKQPTRR